MTLSNWDSFLWIDCWLHWNVPKTPKGRTPLLQPAAVNTPGVSELPAAGWVTSVILGIHCSLPTIYCISDVECILSHSLTHTHTYYMSRVVESLLWHVHLMCHCVVLQSCYDILGSQRGFNLLCSDCLPQRLQLTSQVLFLFYGNQGYISFLCCRAFLIRSGWPQ